MKQTCAFFGLFLIAACSGPAVSVDESPDTRFGHRFEGEAPDGRRTTTIAASPSDGSFTRLPASFETIIVRPAPLHSDSGEVAVEILVKGSFPDACMELHQFSQERSGNLIDATLDMRRPDDTVCMNVRRPYRLYLMLDGTFEEGNYVLKVNGKAVPFSVRAEVEA